MGGKAWRQEKDIDQAKKEKKEDRGDGKRKRERRDASKERKKKRQRLSFKKINILQPSLTVSRTLVFYNSMPASFQNKCLPVTINSYE